MSKATKDILADLILAENLIAGIRDADGKPPGHVEFLTKQRMALDAKRALPAIEAAIEFIGGNGE